MLRVDGKGEEVGKIFKGWRIIFLLEIVVYFLRF